MKDNKALELIQNSHFNEIVKNTLRENVKEFIENGMYIIPSNVKAELHYYYLLKDGIEEEVYDEE